MEKKKYIEPVIDIVDVDNTIVMGSPNNLLPHMGKGEKTLWEEEDYLF